MPDISKQLVQLRKNLGLTQAELAEKIGVHQATISKFELGRLYPDQETISKLTSSGLDLAREKQVNSKMLDIAKEVARIKEESGLSTVGFAKAVGVNNSYLSRILNGRKKPSMKFLNRIAAEAEYLFNQKEEKNMSNQSRLVNNEIGKIVFTFNIANKTFELKYSSHEYEDNTYTYTLILNQEYFNFLKFLSVHYSSQVRNMKVDNVEKVLLLISHNNTNYFYTLQIKIKGDTFTGIVTFKPSNFEDIFEKANEEVVEKEVAEMTEQLTLEEKKESNAERDILILCQNIIQIRDLLDETLELAQKVIQPIVDKEKEIVEVKKESKVIEVVHKAYKQEVGTINYIQVGTINDKNQIIFNIPPLSESKCKEIQQNHWKTYYSYFIYQTIWTYDTGETKNGEFKEFVPTNKIQEIESTDGRGVIGYVEHKAGIVEVIYYDRFVN